jgi:hypothetical protein
VPLANRVIRVDPQPNEDGDSVIAVMLGDGSTFDAAIDLAGAQKLVEILQRQLVLWAHKSARNLSLPQFDVTDAVIGHQGPEAALILTTTQIGAVAFRMSDEILKKVDSEIDRVVTYTSGPQTKQ